MQFYKATLKGKQQVYICLLTSSKEDKLYFDRDFDKLLKGTGLQHEDIFDYILSTELTSRKDIPKQFNIHGYVLTDVKRV